MNNKLVLNPRGRNHIKVMPLKHCMEVPADNKEKLDFCKTIYHDLETKADRKFLEKNSHKGYQISVWEMASYYFLIISIRDEFKMYVNTIYIHTELNDLINIGKFMKTNIDTLMKDYKTQLLDARDELLRNAHPVSEA